jgi:hypothetical protein
MFIYVEIDENGIPFSRLMTPDEIISDTMIPVTEDFDWTSKKYFDGDWVDYIPEPVEPETTQLDRMEEKIDTLVSGTTSENTEAINAFLGV